MNTKPLILVGGGGHCKSVIEAAESQGREILGILDLPETVGSEVLGYPVLGTDDAMVNYVDSAEFVITVGHIKSADLRIKLNDRIKAVGGTLGNVFASTAHISSYARIGMGTVVLHGAVVNADAVIGENCIINTLANVEHDAVIGDFCHISTGAMVNGECIVGEKTFLGSGAIMINAISLPTNSLFAAGSLIRKSFGTSGIYAGNPAHLIIKSVQ